MVGKRTYGRMGFFEILGDKFYLYFVLFKVTIIVMEGILTFALLYRL